LGVTPANRFFVPQVEAEANPSPATVSSSRGVLFLYFPRDISIPPNVCWGV
jgi:hypothetical protein